MMIILNFFDVLEMIEALLYDVLIKDILVRITTQQG